MAVLVIGHGGKTVLVVSTAVHILIEVLEEGNRLVAVGLEVARVLCLEVHRLVVRLYGHRSWIGEVKLSKIEARLLCLGGRDTTCDNGRSCYWLGVRIEVELPELAVAGVLKVCFLGCGSEVREGIVLDFLL